MATYGKHAKAPQQPSQYGKHASAVRVGPDLSQIALSVLLLAALAIVPFTFNRALVAMDNRAFAEPAANALGTLTDATARATSHFVNSNAMPPLAQDAISEEEALQAFLSEVGYTQRVGQKLQADIMAGGCELVSLSIALDAMGLNPDIHAIVANHLTIDGHFATGYSGDPYQRGAGYPAGIVAAANSYLDAIGSNVEARDLTGASFELLSTYVQKGYPVLVWTTMGFEDPKFAGSFDDGKEWYSNEHCVVLYGTEDGKAQVSDPLEGLVERDLQRFAQIYKACGSMAMVIQ